ncbi:Heat shock protein-like protein [Bosea sp. LC85]|uniref:YbaY family lipoprotein n=1 Tax=Bosea sp. LC85 TaxID=1502851 RepID=UPI0004E46D38|nr:YbaY family lipoprotein [Bosea sp. LC85]KFC75611.1 Heat shock protein-like protein [Bosea sp. LC85]
MTIKPIKALISRRSLTGLMALALVTPAGGALAAPMTLRGTVLFRERIALPRTATVEVRLLDVSLADAPAKTIAETRLPARRNPIRYALRFDRAQIEPRRTYALQARITDGERLLFINTTRHTVFAGGRNSTTIRVEHVAREQAEAPRPATPVGRWLAEDIRGGGVIDRLQSVLELAADGKVSGTGGCNRMSGSAKLSGPQISFGPLASTRMACTLAAMNQESKFFAALESARSWRIDRQDKLVLLDAGGTPIMRLARM